MRRKPKPSSASATGRASAWSDSAIAALVRLHYFGPEGKPDAPELGAYWKYKFNWAGGPTELPTHSGGTDIMKRRLAETSAVVFLAVKAARDRTFVLPKFQT